jgi:hypothetical protein
MNEQGPLTDGMGQWHRMTFVVRHVGGLQVMAKDGTQEGVLLKTV